MACQSKELQYAVTVFIVSVPTPRSLFYRHQTACLVLNYTLSTQQ